MLTSYKLPRISLIWWRPYLRTIPQQNVPYPWYHFAWYKHLHQAQQLYCLGKINNIPIPLYPILQYKASTPPNTSDDISLSYESSDLMSYTIIIDSRITIEQSYDELIKAGRYENYQTSSNNVATSLEVIPHFLKNNSKLTMDHKGAFNKVYIHFSPKISSQFSVRHNTRF